MRVLLASGGAIWLTNVIAFGLWYWDLDRDGAAARARGPGRPPAFVFSPTDVSPIRPWAKLMMMAEEAVSLVVAVLVIARAVNILHLTTSSSRPDRPPSSGGPVRPAAGAVRQSLRAG